MEDETELAPGRERGLPGGSRGGQEGWWRSGSDVTATGIFLRLAAEQAARGVAPEAAERDESPAPTPDPQDEKEG